MLCQQALTFGQFAELHLPTLVTSRANTGTDGDMVGITVDQGGTTVACGRVRLSRAADKVDPSAGRPPDQP